MSPEERVLAFAPSGSARRVLEDVGACVVDTPGDLRRELAVGAGVLVLEAEAVDTTLAPPPELPLILLGGAGDAERQALDVLGPGASVVLLDRPVRDVALRHALHAARRPARLEGTLRELNAFSYSIAHDLRAPLRALHGYSEMLESDFSGELPPPGLDLLRQIRKGARRMDGLIQDLLRYSRLGREDVKVEPVDVRSVLSAALQDLETEIQDSGASIVSELSGRPLLADETLLGQALMNLISNATKFVARGTRPRVVVRDELRGGWMRVIVEDNGIGVASRHHERIFEAFERLHAPEAYPGTGIGLSIVKRVVERMGGRFGLESEEGRGSRFWIEQKSSMPLEFQGRSG